MNVKKLEARIRVLEAKVQTLESDTHSDSAALYVANYCR